MKRFVRIAVCIALLTAPVSMGQDYTAEKIQDDVLVITGAGGNITVFNTTDGLLVVDTFLSPVAARAARGLIDEAFPGMPVRYVINTHYHWDHSFGNQVFSDALIVAHIKNSDRVRTDYAERAETMASADDKIRELEAHLADHAGTDEENVAEVKEQLEQFRSIKENYGDFELTPAPFSLEKGARIEHGGKTFMLYFHGPGHTDGDIIVHSLEDRVLVMGDLLFNRMLPYIDTGAGSSVHNWIMILDKMIAMEDQYDTVIPGHGAVDTVEALREKRAFLLDLWAAVSGVHVRGGTLEQARETVTLDAYRDWGRYRFIASVIEAVWNQLEQ